jgi:hypothetical protein
MKQLAAKFLNTNGYFPEVPVKAEVFDNDKPVAFKSYYQFTCHANDNTLQVAFDYNANVKGLLQINSSYEVVITVLVSDSNQKLDNEKETRRQIALTLNSMATEILKSAATM